MNVWLCSSAYMNIALHSFINTIHHMQSINICEHSPLPLHVCVGIHEPYVSACTLLISKVVRSAICAEQRYMPSLCSDEESQAVALLMMMLLL